MAVVVVVVVVVLVVLAVVVGEDEAEARVDERQEKKGRATVDEARLDEM